MAIFIGMVFVSDIGHRTSVIGHRRGGLPRIPPDSPGFPRWLRVALDSSPVLPCWLPLTPSNYLSIFLAARCVEADQPPFMQFLQPRRDVPILDFLSSRGGCHPAEVWVSLESAPVIGDGMEPPKPKLSLDRDHVDPLPLGHVRVDASVDPLFHIHQSAASRQRFRVSHIA